MSDISVIEIQENQYNLKDGIARNALSDDSLTVINNPISINTLSAQHAQSTLIDILPIQEGSGDPSPSNVRPISGVSSTSLEVCGTNLLQITAQTSTISNVKYTVNADGTITAKPTATLTQQSMFDLGTITFKAGKLYTLSGCPTNRSTGISYVLFARGNNSAGFEQKIDSGTGITFGITQDVTTTITIIFYSGYSSTDEKVFRPMISMSSDAVFEKYKSPTNLTFNFGQTVFGGNLNIESGVLTIDRTCANILWGDTAITSQLSNTTRKIFTLTAGGTSAFAMCNIAPIVRQYALDEIHCYVDGELFALFLPPNTSDDTQIQIAYSLASPYTIQLTGSQVELLKGVNNITSDGDSVTLTYRSGEVATLADVIELDKKIDASRALGRVYSTNERIVGTWIDGKPLYAMTFKKDNVGNGNQSVGSYSGIPVDIFWVEGFYITPDGASLPNLWGNANNVQILKLYARETDSTVRSVVSDSYYNNSTAVATLYYTKTTD